MDKDLNIILYNSIEYHGFEDNGFINKLKTYIIVISIVELLQVPEKVVSRRIGMAMIPGSHVVKIFCLL